MFSFFTKKHFLIDQLSGFIDIHNHILPGIDDGAKNVTESIELIKSFGEFGVHNFICTPHIMENYYPNDPTTISRSLSLLKNELKLQGLDQVKITAAAEHMIDSGFEKLVENKKVMPLGANYLLIEMSYLQPSINFDEALEILKEKGYFPILAHPERYVYFHNKPGAYKKLKEKGLLFQSNILSFTNFYGKEVWKEGLNLLEEKEINFVGTDVHNLKQLNFLKEIRIKSNQLNMIQPIIDRTINNFI